MSARFVDYPGEELPFAVHAVSVTPKGRRTPCVYRYRTAEGRAAAWPDLAAAAPPLDVGASVEFDLEP